MERTEYNRLYMRKYREKNRLKIRERDNNRKKWLRRNDSAWLAKERERRRKYGKYRKPRNLEKQAINHRTYWEKNRNKESARAAVRLALKNGRLIRPSICAICGKIPERHGREKQFLRADHFQGYERSNWLDVRWICLDCDGKLNRSKNKLVK